MQNRNVVFLAVVALLGCLGVRGIAAPASDPPGRFSVRADEAGRWWFQDPAGKRFLSMGVNNVNPAAWNPRAGTTYYDAATRQFSGDIKAWGQSTRRLLLDNGFNTLACWSGPEIPDGDGLYRTVVLYLVGNEGTRCLQALRPGLEEMMRKNLREMMAKYPNRSNIIGVYFDNEMPWFGRNGWARNLTETLLETAIELPGSDPAHTAAVDFLKGRYKTAEEFSTAWGEPLKSWEDLTVAWMHQSNTFKARADRGAFAALLAERFFQTAQRVTREELPGMLLLGTRFAGDAPDEVVREAGKVCDVMSLNTYPPAMKVSMEQVAKFWLLGGRPIMITEFAYRGKENNSANPNTRGAGMIVPTQKDRAEAYRSYVTSCLELPVIIGMHWFEFADQSPQGRFDGEDSNYGIVDLENRPYKELLAAMKATHAAAERTHGESTQKMPRELLKPKGVSYNPGQYPDRPGSIDLLAGPWMKDPGTWNASDASIKVRKVAEGFALDYVAGNEYGVGFDIYGPQAKQKPKALAPAADLDGYGTIVLQATAPKGVQINVTLLEAAAAAPGQTEYNVGAGDDGEAFISRALFGTGERAAYRVKISDLERQPSWGNQGGNQEIQMAAVRNLGVQIQGQPKQGTVIVHSLVLER